MKNKIRNYRENVKSAFAGEFVLTPSEYREAFEDYGRVILDCPCCGTHTFGYGYVCEHCGWEQDNVHDFRYFVNLFVYKLIYKLEFLKRRF